MTSAHHPQTAVVVRSFNVSQERREGEVEATGNRLPRPPHARRGGAEQLTSLLHRGTERTARVMPVQNYSRRFKGPGHPFTRTSRVIACRQVSRVSSEVSHVVSPCRWFRFQEPSERQSAWSAEKVSIRSAKL